MTNKLEALSTESLLLQKELSEVLHANNSLFTLSNLLIIILGILGILGIVSTIGTGCFFYSKLAAGILAVNQQHANSLAMAHEVLRDIIIKQSSNEAVLALVTKINNVAAQEAEVQAAIAALHDQIGGLLVRNR